MPTINTSAEKARTIAALFLAVRVPFSVTHRTDVGVDKAHSTAITVDDKHAETLREALAIATARIEREQDEEQRMADRARRHGARV